MNFKVFLLIFVLPIFLSKYPPIFTDISDISVKSKYRYIRNYRYFVPCIQPTNLYNNEFTRIYIKIKLDINEREKMYSKGPTIDLQYSQVYFKIWSSTCHESIFDQQK